MTLDSVIVFADLDVSAFDDPAFNQTFYAQFTALMTRAANVPESRLTILRIRSGSTAVTSRLAFESTDSAPSTQEFVSTLSILPERVFRDSPLAAYGEIVSSLRLVRTNSSEFVPCRDDGEVDVTPGEFAASLVAAWLVGVVMALVAARIHHHFREEEDDEYIGFGVAYESPARGPPGVKKVGP